MDQADFVIIGSGQGGVPLAVKLQQEGHEVTLFERDTWGGTCVNTGCYPSKYLLASAHAAADARRAADLGVNCQVEVDFKAVMDRVRGGIHPQGTLDWLQKSGVKTIEAEAEFIAPHTIHGGDTTVEAQKVVINTGKSPFIPDIDGLAGTPYHTYETIWQLEQQPQTLLVLGAGYTGIELAQAMQRLGSEVHVIEIGERPVDDEEVEVSEALQEALEADGVTFHLETSVQQVDYTDGQFRLTLENEPTRLEGDAFLVVAGRRPSVANLRLSEWGVELDDQGNVQVDDHFRTTSSGIYAIGDVTGQPAFTHVSWEDHRRLLSSLNGGNGQERQQGDRVLAYAFFTEPQVGRAGLTLAQAKAQGYDARAATVPLSSAARAGATGHSNGFYRMVIDDQSERILGATLVGPQSAELIHIFLAHMEAGSSWRVLEQSQHIHPTYAEQLPVLARKFKQN